MKRLILLVSMCLLCFGVGLSWAAEHEVASSIGSTEVGHEVKAGGTHQAIHEKAALAEHGEAEHEGHVDIGELLPLWSCIPFAGILLSIALFPLFAPRFWHHHYGKVAAFWALVLAIPFVMTYKHAAVHEILHIYITDYFPFIILLWSLFTVAGGIYLRGTLVGTPLNNTIMLGIGTGLASWMGTTGAAMLMIRPFLRANKNRKYRTFMVCFFIFLIANIGGALTPLGDPPLFLGFLHGVPFFWTFKILPHMLFVIGCLLTIYFIMDLYYYKKEGVQPYTGEKEPLKLEGWYNFFFLAGIVAAVLMSGLVKWGEVKIFGIPRTIQDLVRDGILILMGILSLIVTPSEVREGNEFSWAPIEEVAYLFAGIFMTMIPCLAILKAGEEGAAAPLIRAVKEPAHYFWITGALSSFLDNAPTYLTFFTSALGKFYAGLPEPMAVKKLLAEHPVYLEAISAGAVFFGANTYIGNAPNFMVRSIAEEAGTPMPSFFGYIFKYSLVFLIPMFILVTLIFYH